MSLAQEKQKIPAEFFARKWLGILKGNYFERTSHPSNTIQEPPINIDFSIEINWLDAILYPFGVKGVVGILPSSSKGIPISVIENNKPFYETVLLTAVFNVGENPSPALLGLVSLFVSESLDNQVDLKDDCIQVKHIREDYYPSGHLNYRFTVEGTIYAGEHKKKIFPKDIKPDEPIKTDKKTQLEITMPSKDVIKVAQNSEAVIRSESLMEVMKGKIHGLIKKLKPKTKFEIRTLTATTGVRGTEYALSVEDDGTTTVVVLDGEVEFSDKENKKTVIVKKNQKSVVKPGALPINPEEIDPERILNWWE
jgi:hypothetical protein